jgi:hypothetical protein
MKPFIVFLNFPVIDAQVPVWAAPNLFGSSSEIVFYHVQFGYSQQGPNGEPVSVPIAPFASEVVLPSRTNALLAAEGVTEFVGLDAIAGHMASRKQVFQDALTALALADVVVTDGNVLSNGDEAIFFTYAHLMDKESILVCDNNQAPRYMSELSTQVTSSRNVHRAVNTLFSTASLSRMLQQSQSKLNSVISSVGSVGEGARSTPKSDTEEKKTKKK